MVQNLANALHAKGIDVTLFAPSDWKVTVPHRSTLSESLWLMEGFSDQNEYVRRNYIFGSQTAVLRDQTEFDLIHLNSQRSAYSVARGSHIPCVATLHSRISPETISQLQEAGVATIGLTHSQVGGLPVDAIISNGIPTRSIAPSSEPGEYLLVVGRLSRQNPSRAHAR